jgi:PHP family Zn ribbon phosphoesterase
MDVPLKAIEKLDVGRLAEAIGRMREGQVSVTSGYDGEYGLIKCLSDP